MADIEVLDTSGAVDIRDLPSFKGGFNFRHWEDLDPFTQGYVEALFAEAQCEFAPLREDGTPGQFNYACGFSDLAPKTLAAILTDCAAFNRAFDLPIDPEMQRRDGTRLWAWRQGDTLPGFPSLTPYLGDDGKVYLRET